MDDKKSHSSSPIPRTPDHRQPSTSLDIPFALSTTSSFPRSTPTFLPPSNFIIFSIPFVWIRSLLGLPLPSVLSPTHWLTLSLCSHGVPSFLPSLSLVFTLYLRFRYFRFSVFFQPPRIFSSSFLYLNVRLDNLSCKTPACLPYHFGASGGFRHTTLRLFFC